MQRTEDVEFEVIDLDNNKTTIVSGKDLVQAGIAYKTPQDAFCGFLRGSVMHAVDRHYDPPMHFLRALLDVCHDEGRFSWLITAKRAAALTTGGLASIFSINPASDAIKTISSLIKDKTGYQIAGKNVLIVVVQTANVSRSAALSTYSAMRLINTYLGKTSEAERFLKYQEATCLENTKTAGRKTFDLACAVAANIPTFLTTKSIGIPLAVATSIACVSISWLGMSGLKLWPANVYPARRAELAYLHEQTEVFLRLDYSRQNAILDELERAGKVDEESNENSMEKYKKIYARILNLARPNANAAAVPVQEMHEKTTTEKVLPKGIGALSAFSQVGFIEYAGVGTAAIFHHSTSPGAISAGLVAALLALLPGVGFGYLGGSHAGRAMLSDDNPLSCLNAPKTREALKWLLQFVSALAIGNIFTFTYEAVSNFTHAAKIKGPLEDIIKAVTIGACYVGSSIAIGYYLLCLLDDILIYFAQRCGDEKIQRLYAFVLEMRKLESLTAEMNAENYLELLKWKLQGQAELSDLMHGVFDNRLSESEYEQLKNDLNTSTTILRDRTTLSHYNLMPSFFVRQKEENAARHGGLRRRFNC